MWTSMEMEEVEGVEDMEAAAGMEDGAETPCLTPARPLVN